MRPLLIVLLVCMGLLVGSTVADLFHQPLPPKFIVPFSNEKDHEVMDWVIQYMFPNEPVMYNLPLTRRLVRRDIGIIYCELAGEYCEKDIQERIAGLFDHWTETVYVPDDMGECQAIVSLAHEYVHYVQHYRDGNIAKVSEPLREMVQDLREEEAYEIDDIFEIEFCK